MRYIAILALALTACTKTTVIQPTVTGAWAGTIVGGGTLAMQLNDQHGAVTGSGTLVSGNETYAQTISGAFEAPNLSLTMVSGQHPPIALTAFVNRDSMVAHLNGSGFTNHAVTLRR